MKVEKTALAEAATTVSRAVEKRSSVPVLANILLTGGETGLSVTATDLDITLLVKFEGEAESPMSICMPADRFTQIVKLLPAGPVSITEKDDWAHIKSGRSRFKLAALPGESFPEVPTPDGTGFTLPGSTLATAIGHVLPSVANEESRYTLNGVLLFAAEGVVHLISTDGHRLSLSKFEHDVPDMEVLVPDKAIRQIARLAASEPQVSFTVNDNFIFAEFPGTVMAARKLSGMFPNWKMVVPQDNHVTLKVNAPALALALKQSNVMADELARTVAFHIGRDKVRLSAHTSEAGEAEVEVSAESNTDDLTIGLNGLYVLDFLNSHKGDVVGFFKDAETQALFTGNYTYVVMPVKI